ncbi:MAG TPA: SDR family NAD(P)-dependent oxidoreductase [Polyangiales bacterium]
MKQLRGKVAIVTGASKGLGVHIARALAEQGVNLVLVARSAEGLALARRSAEDLGVRAITVPVDLARSESIAQVLACAQDAFGRVDILINNAGLMYASDYATIEPHDVDETIHVNLRAPMQLTRAVLPGMIARGEGHIVNLSSIAGLGGAPYLEAYSATKHALVGFTRSLRLTLRAEGHPIGVSVVCPGFVPDTGMFHDNKRETGAVIPERFGAAPAPDVARAVLNAIRRNDAEVIVNSLPLRPLMVLVALFPGLAEPLSSATGIAEVCRTMARGRLASGTRGEELRLTPASHTPGGPPDRILDC